MTSLENIRVFTQSAIRIQNKDGVVIYLDPFSLTDAEAAHDADYVFITHAHFDHFSPEDIARVAGDHTELVAPASMGAEVARVAGLDTDVNTISGTWWPPVAWTSTPNISGPSDAIR